MFTFKVDFATYDRSVRKTETRRAQLLRRGVMTGARAGERYARNNHPHKRRTGRLTSKAHLFVVLGHASRNAAKASFVNTSPYSRFVEYPTRAHVIRPKASHGFIGPLRRGQSRRDETDIGTHRVALRFVIGGKTIFRAKVMHPGTPGFPFMRPALKPAVEAAEKSIRGDWRQVAKDIWR
jgi:hypothetical protein